MRLGIVITSYNHHQWVERSIESAARQTYGQKEIYIMDDSSTDGSWSAISNMIEDREVVRTANFERIKGKILRVPTEAVRVSHCGNPAKLRNMGIQSIFGVVDAFGFLDSDDYWVAEYAAKAIKVFEEQPLVLGVYSDNYLVFGDIPARQHRQSFSRENILGGVAFHNSCFVRKSAFETVGLYNDTFQAFEHYDLALRLSQRGMILHVPEPLCGLRGGAHKLTATLPQEVLQENWSRIGK